jgi:hypothetical protein
MKTLKQHLQDKDHLQIALQTQSWYSTTEAEEDIISAVKEWLQDAPQEVKEIINDYYLCRPLTKKKLLILAKFYLAKNAELLGELGK